MSRPLLAVALGVAALVTAISASALAPAAAAPPDRRPKHEPLPRRDRDAGEDRRRDPEPSPEGPTMPLDVEEQPLVVSLPTFGTACHVRGWERMQARLLALENETQFMSLELWGDKELYHEGDHVTFHLRSQRGAYVTLYWVGPAGHIVVAMDNVRVPPERNVTIDTGGIIVPPFGKEQWVALATLEPLPIGCTTEAAMLDALARHTRVEHGVGRWEVVSVH